MLADKMKREELDGQPVGHSLWKQGSLEAYNRVLFGHFDGEVWALRQRKADYDETMRLSDGTDSCWSNTGCDSDSAAEIEVDIEPLALEGDVVAVIQGGEGGYSWGADWQEEEEERAGSAASEALTVGAGLT